jgi:hypothetical protein
VSSSDRARDRDPRSFASHAPLGDLRFRALLSDDDWQRVPIPVRRRFSKRLAPGSTIVYVGQVSEVRFSRTGWLLAQGCRLIGGPFPICRDVGVATVVAVTEDAAANGQIWTRLYARKSGLPQVVQSSKRFAGPTGLEEHVGFGIGMTLKVRVEEAALAFRSVRFFVEAAGMRFHLPAWASPGTLTVTHRDADDGQFSFLLEVVHPFFGLLIRQLALFKESDCHV